MDLSHVFDDSRPHRVAIAGTSSVQASIPLRTPADKRLYTRFDKAFVVVVGSEVYGDTHAVARNLSAGGILVEMPYAPPLGTIVTVHFQYLRDGEDNVDEIVARAEVKHHHYLNFSSGPSEAARARAVGMRFLEFVDVGETIPAARVQ